MDEQEKNATLEPRLPTLDDLLQLCRRFNEAGVRYVVVGEFAVIQHGFGRTTAALTLLVEDSFSNLEQIGRAVGALPEGTIELQPHGLDKRAAVRVGNEFSASLMKSISGVDYAEAAAHVSVQRIRGVLIPFANAPLLLRLRRRSKPLERIGARRATQRSGVIAIERLSAATE